MPTLSYKNVTDHMVEDTTDDAQSMGMGVEVKASIGKSIAFAQT